MAVIQWLADFLHSFPHVGFTFEHVSNEFRPYEWDYLQSLLFWGAVGLALCILLLLIIIIVWSVRCCCQRGDEHVKRLAQIKKLCNGLFVVSIFCFMWLGVSLYSNERINRGACDTAESLTDLGNDVQTVLYKGNFRTIFRGRTNGLIGSTRS